MGMIRKAAGMFSFVTLAGVAAVLLAAQNADLLPRTATAEGATAVEVGVALPAARQDSLQSTQAVVDRSGAPLQCAIYARQRTGIALTGAARTWWPQADGRYRRAPTPTAGSVIVMGGTESGHVAVVTRVLNSRQIVIDHANWLGGGEIITGALVEDASANNDWSSVRVWNVETNSMGLRAYPVFGFVGPQSI